MENRSLGKRFLRAMATYFDPELPWKEKVDVLLDLLEKHYNGKDWRKLSQNEQNIVSSLISLGHLEKEGDTILLSGGTGGT